MTLIDEILNVLLYISTLLIFVMSLFIVKIKKKKQIHFSFLSVIILIFIWNISVLVLVFIEGSQHKLSPSVEQLYYLSVIFTPVCLLYMGVIFAKTHIALTRKHLLILVIPFISLMILFTNNSHHLFFKKFSLTTSELIYGEYFPIHTVYSYSCIIIGLYYLIYFSVKNSGFFSKQSLLIFWGILVPLLTDTLSTFKLVNWPVYIENISFSFAILCFSLAIFKFKFLNIAPIALQQVIDRISDGFIVVNEEFQIIDFNSTMITTFKNIFIIGRNTNLGQLLEKFNLGPDDISLLDLIEKARKEEKSISYDKHITENSFDRYFKIEITPIINKQSFLGTILLFKDTTENVKAIATIEEKHAIMMEQERLASLGQLIGGIAHNLKTPIMSIAGAVEGLKDLVAEYEISIGDKSVTPEDHREIVAEMRTWLDKIKPYCSYMTDVINTVKGQTIQSKSASMFGFTINELIKRIELLLKYELIRYNCSLNTTIRVDPNMEFYGDVNSLVQVFDNIIVNAIQAYGGKNGEIDLMVEEKDRDILFAVRDYAKGIPERIKNRLLKEMVTTKGKNGTGLGLYMSNSTIKGRFGGKMWFESETGKGTSFFIQLPHKRSANVN